MFVLAFLFTAISLTYSRPIVAVGIAFGAITTKMLASALLWGASKVEEWENSIIKAVALLLMIGVAVVILQTSMAEEFRHKLVHKDS